MSSLVKYLFKSFTHCYWVFSLLSFVGSSYVLDEYFVRHVIWKYFLSLRLYFIHLMSFTDQIFSFNKPINHTFLLCLIHLISYLKNDCLAQDLKNFLLEFYILHLYLCTIFSLFFFFGIREEYMLRFILLNMDVQMSQHHLWKSLFFP